MVTPGAGVSSDTGADEDCAAGAEKAEDTVAGVSAAASCAGAAGVDAKADVAGDDQGVA